FLPDPMSFRCLQARTGTLVSGSVALQFFDRTRDDSSDLHLYVYPAYRRVIGWWLLHEGFRFVAGPGQANCFNVAILARKTTGLKLMPGVSSSYTFHREVDGHCARIQMMVADRAPVEVVLSYHSTCMMNIIAYDKACCLFPRATLEDRLSLLCSSSEDRSQTWADMVPLCVPPSFHLLEDLEWCAFVPPRNAPFYPFTLRGFGDANCWTIPL
ncbi:hypothetical protein GY45DRAFT_1215878, partial [Cubamyces sp. BRFM 1775]